MSYPKKVYDFFGENKDAYFTYLSANNKVEIFSKYISKRLNQKYRSKNLHILCVGGGTGNIDLNIIKQLYAKKLTIDYVDPSRSMKTLFVRKATQMRMKDKLNRLDLSRFEVNSYMPSKADIILCISSVYFLEGWRVVNNKNPLLKIYNSLVDEGAAVIVLKSEKSDHCAVKRAGGGGRTCGRDIKVILRKLKISHYWEIISTNIDISDCFQQGSFKPNRRGIQLLSFMFKGQWDEFSKKTRTKIVKTLKNKVKIVNNKAVLKADHECIWIVKPSFASLTHPIQDQLVDEATEKLAAKLKEKIRSFNKRRN